ncbi:MAG: SMP-30/gluconolactonase/LRE family protein [Actinomycetota bacterium]|nr:SMP-30/gluconolactonase/LRE family protein [Actinomycetota bacterium]
MPTTLRPDVLVAGGDRLGEGPLWDDRTGTLHWIDISDGEIWSRTGLDDDATVERRTTPSMVGTVALDEDGRLFAGLVDGIAVLDGAEGDAVATAGGDPDWRMVATYGDQPADVRSNDGKADPFGSLVIGTAHHDGAPDLGKLYRLRPDRADLEVLLEPVTISNGLDWDETGTTLTYIDTPTRTLRRFRYRPDGPLEPTGDDLVVDRTLGHPDGMCLDADGCAWVALWGGGGVARFTPAGVLDTFVEVPTTNVTCCCFAGADLDRLVITTASQGLDAGADRTHAGSVFVVDPGVTGRRANRIWRT